MELTFIVTGFGKIELKNLMGIMTMLINLTMNLRSK